jgi:hypothetical protein
MSETAAKPQKLSVAETRLQYLLLGTTVPLREGGGVVFPNGFPGLGYRLDEWQFDRYRAGLDRSLLSDAAKKRMRLAIGILVIYLALVVFIGYGGAWLRSVALLNSDLGNWLPVSVVLLLMTAALYALRLTNRPAMRFAEQFKGAPRVSRFAYLRQRGLALLASGLLKPTALHLRIAFHLGLISFLLFSDYVAANHPSLGIVVAAMLAYSTSRRLYICYVYWTFRLRLGRAPTPADLKPVSLSEA